MAMMILTAAALTWQAGPEAVQAGWRSTAVIEGTYRSCVASSPIRHRAGAEYQLLISLGDRHAIGLQSDRPLPPANRAVLRTAQGATHYLIALEEKHEGGRHLAWNPVSRSTFRQMLADLRSAGSASLRIGGTDYPLPVERIEQGVAVMTACLRRLEAES